MTVSRNGRASVIDRTTQDRTRKTWALTRRQLLAGTGKVALLAVTPFGCAPAGNVAFADGTFWDDGSGWTS